jgi:rhodanese-related sulfurtransferase
MSGQQNGSVTVPEIGPLDASELISQGAYLLDVRESDEWHAGRALKAQHIPLGELNERYAEIPRDEIVVVCCRSGGRSAMAAAGLISLGYDARNLTGGMQAWEKAELLLIDASGAPGVVA